MTTKTKIGYEVDQNILDEIDNLKLNKRLAGLKQRYLDDIPKLASERGTYYMESWKETEGQPIQLRIARAVKKVLENVPVAIFDDELVVGSITKFFRGSYAIINYDSSWVLDLLEQSKKGEISMGGLNVIGKLDEDVERELREHSDYFKGKTNREIEEQVCRLKLRAMSIGIDKLMPEQIVYLASSGEGT